MSWEIIEGDCLESLRGMADCSVDSIVTDPPYGLGKEPDALAMLRDWLDTGHHEVKGRGFMGKAWDAFVPQPEVWAECLRVLKPGGHLLAFGGTRTIDLVVLGIRIAGFEIRDQIASMSGEQSGTFSTLEWVTGTGFPKSLDVSKAIDAAAGADREVIGQGGSSCPGIAAGTGCACAETYGDERAQSGATVHAPATAPATEAAKKWDGWGTSPKPSHEPIVVARKPLEGTVAANVQKWGTGGINVDATRVQTRDGYAKNRVTQGGDHFSIGSEEKTRGTVFEPSVEGRWPPNLLLTHSEQCTAAKCAPGCPVREMGEQSGERPTPRTYTRGAHAEGEWLHAKPAGSEQAGFGDTGTAARFFPSFRYVPKPSRSERDAGLTIEKLYCTCEVWENEDQQAATPAATDTQPPGDTTGSTTPDSGATGSPMLSSGSASTGRSRKDSRSTTSMGTSKTIGSRTSRSSILSPTSDCTPGANCGTVSGGSPAESVENTSVSGRKTGTSRRKGGRSTVGADPATSGSSSKTSEGVRPRCEKCGKRKQPTGAEATGRKEGSAGLDNARAGAGRTARVVLSDHPTVKPIALMRWLCKLVTPPGGVVLDPFAGSGTTGCAARLEGFRFVGCELSPDYAEIARERIAFWEKVDPNFDGTPKAEKVDDRQRSLFDA